VWALRRRARVPGKLAFCGRQPFRRALAVRCERRGGSRARSSHGAGALHLPRRRRAAEAVVAGPSSGSCSRCGHRRRLQLAPAARPGPRGRPTNHLQPPCGCAPGLSYTLPYDLPYPYAGLNAYDSPALDLLALAAAGVRPRDRDGFGTLAGLRDGSDAEDVEEAQAESAACVPDPRQLLGDGLLAPLLDRVGRARLLLCDPACGGPVKARRTGTLPAAATRPRHARMAPTACNSPPCARL
jgi:hypothetical protein